MIEGITEIELTDINTGKKEKVVDKNMVTNALKYIYEKSIGERNYLYSNAVPIIGKTLGGVLAFNDTIAEDPENIMPPGTVECIAHAGMDAYNGGNERRGSYNEQESEMLENGMKFVWDFTTSQGNGTIKCVSLTSNVGGKCGLGFKGTDNTEVKTLIPIAAVGFAGHHSTKFNYVAKGVSNKVFKIEKYSNPLDFITITKDYKTSKLVETINIPLQISFTPAYNAYNKDGNYFNIVCGDTNGKKVHLTKYNIIAGSNEQVEIDLSQQGISNINFRRDPYGDFAVIGDYLYLKSGTKIAKVNTKNAADVKVIDAYTYSVLINMGNRIYTEKVCVDENDNVFNTFKTELAGNYWYDLHTIDDNKLFYVSHYSPRTIYFYAPYMATINNLQSPVVKTAEKTMKITYTIRETAE